MSASEFFSDVIHGNLTHAYQRLVDWYSGWPPQLKIFVSSLTDDEGKILMAAAEEAIAGAFAGQSIPTIADALWDTLKDKVPSKAKEDLKNALGVLLRAPTPPATIT